MSENKRVLLADQSEASRQVAESILRQNGYEVIAVSSSDKALEVVEFTRPGLILVGSSLKSTGDKPLYERLQNEPRSSSVPMLIIDSEENGDLPFPSDVILSLPLDSKDLVSKVGSLANKDHGPEKSDDVNPLTSGDLEDDLLDSALGLDQIEVTESEIMDKTKVKSGHKAQRNDSDKVGFDDSLEDSFIGDNSGKIESINIEEDRSDIVQNKNQRKNDSIDTSGKLEIMPDQFGLSSPDSFDLADDESSDHDYNWFINEMRSDEMNPDKGFKPPARKDLPESSDLEFSETSSYVDPVTPGPSGKPKDSSPGGGVDHFIEEFKKEVEKIQSDLPAEESGYTEPGNSGETHDMVWEEKLENLTVDQLGIFTRQLSKDVAERLAESLISQIDKEKLLAMIKAEIVARIRQ